MMHTEYDTQTVTNTLALYGVRRRPRILPRVGYAIALAFTFCTSYGVGMVVKGLLGW